MILTIFCNFETQDIADIAVGKLREDVTGIRSIHYVAGYRANTNFLNKAVQNTARGGFFNTAGYEPPAPARPVTVKITCGEKVADAVVSKLVNLHASQIVRTR